jgi:hypothetical protein
LHKRPSQGTLLTAHLSECALCVLHLKHVLVVECWKLFLLSLEGVIFL